MSKFIKVPIPIEAEQYKLGLEDGFLSLSTLVTSGNCDISKYTQPKCTLTKGVPYIDTPEGKHYISEGDYIITGIHNERYPCKKEIFEKCYIPLKSLNKEQIKQEISNLLDKFIIQYFKKL